jgi:hypothetical protein
VDQRRVSDAAHERLERTIRRVRMIGAPPRMCARSHARQEMTIRGARAPRPRQGKPCTLDKEKQRCGRALGNARPSIFFSSMWIGTAPTPAAFVQDDGANRQWAESPKTTNRPRGYCREAAILVSFVFVDGCRGSAPAAGVGREPHLQYNRVRIQHPMTSMSASKPK